MTKYQTHAPETKLRVIQAAREGRDWGLVATCHGVNLKTAAHWVRRYGSDNGDVEFPRRGGHRHSKITTHHLERLEVLLSDNPSMTLGEMAAVLEKEFCVSVTPQTVKTKVDGLGFTTKNKHYELQYMNTQTNKEKRCDFLRQLLAYQAEEKAIYYMDETNYCLWTSHNRGWSNSGDRMVEVRVTGGGGNMHISACIGIDGLVYAESRFGSNRGPKVKAFVRATLQALSAKGPLNNIVLVADNAPSHSKIEKVFQETEFQAATLLRLGPYSPMLNPIESVFSSFKSKVKAYFQQNCAAIVATPPGQTMTAHRKSFQVRAYSLFLAPSSSATMCAKFYRHILRVHDDVFQLKPMKVGS